MLRSTKLILASHFAINFRDGNGSNFSPALNMDFPGIEKLEMGNYVWQEDWDIKDQQFASSLFVINCGRHLISVFFRSSYENNVFCKSYKTSFHVFILASL